MIIMVVTSGDVILLKISNKEFHGTLRFRHGVTITPKNWETLTDSGWKSMCGEIITFGRADPLPKSFLGLMAFLNFTSLRRTVIKSKRYKFTSV